MLPDIWKLFDKVNFYILVDGNTWKIISKIYDLKKFILNSLIP